MSEFAGKTVLVTGAGRGIGRRIAREFAADGAAVCANYAHSAEGAETLVEEIRAAGGSAIACKADISISAEVAAMVDTALAEFGAIDILVNNAGLSSGGPFLDIAEADWDRVYAVNLKGPFLVSQAVARRMLADGGGVIVNISATTAIHGRPNAADYCATKAGLRPHSSHTTSSRTASQRGNASTAVPTLYVATWSSSGRKRGAT